MIKRAQGLLAPLKGTERYLTVGTSHMTAGIRASNHKCKAGVKSLEGAAGGLLDLTNQRAKDPTLDIMHKVGWDFKIIKDVVVQTWSQVPIICERAQSTQINVGIQPRLRSRLAYEARTFSSHA